MDETLAVALVVALTLAACGGTEFSAGTDQTDAGGGAGTLANSSQAGSNVNGGAGGQIADGPGGLAITDARGGSSIPEAGSDDARSDAPTTMGHCGPANCAGCCGPLGNCLGGSSVYACGLDGVQCVVCPWTCEASTSATCSTSPYIAARAPSCLSGACTSTGAARCCYPSDAAALCDPKVGCSKF